MEGGEGSRQVPSRTLSRQGQMDMARNRMAHQSSRLYSPLEPPQIQTSYSPHQLSNPMGYQSEYSQETPRQPSYPSYGSSMDYNLPQTTTSTYATYPARQATSMTPILPNQISQFAGQYYGVPSEPSTPVSAISTIQPPQQPSQSQYSPVSYEQTRYTSNYISPPGMQTQTEPLQDFIHPQQQQQQQEQQQQLSPQEQTRSGLGQFDTENAYSDYQKALVETFQNIRDGRLSSAGKSILEVSRWLLSNAVNLGTVEPMTSNLQEIGLRSGPGLVRDDKSLHAYRTRMWNEFNSCWIEALRKQKELVQEGILATELQPARDLLSIELLEKMGNELVDLCDGLEKHGLVDYQFGVWEEQIIDEIKECLELMIGRGYSRTSQPAEESTPSIQNPPNLTAVSGTNTPNVTAENAYGLDRHTEQPGYQQQHQRTSPTEGSGWGAPLHGSNSLNQFPTTRV